jgi:3,4-dihydroxy 2-butanone 4-phosphate synthase/GTP cyclohydrolase II
MTLVTTAEAIAALRDPKPVIVCSDDSKATEAHLGLTAQFATPQLLEWTIRFKSGFIRLE